MLQWKGRFFSRSDESPQNRSYFLSVRWRQSSPHLEPDFFSKWPPTKASSLTTVNPFLFYLEKNTATRNVLLWNEKGLESDPCTDKIENKIFLI
jgi:hypothetical protein